MVQRLLLEDVKRLSAMMRVGEEAAIALSSSQGCSNVEYVQHMSAVRLKNIALAHAEALARPLLIRDVKKLVAGSYLSSAGDHIFDDVYAGAVDGLRRGLLKFEPGRSTGVSYVFQWASAYARKELVYLEALPSGVSSQKMLQFRKIAAVRHKLADDLGREPKDEEVLEFFHSGKSDAYNKFKGRKGTGEGVSKSSASLTLDIVAQQRVFEMDNITPVQVMDVRVTHVDPVLPWEGSVFGAFVEKYAHVFAPGAVPVLKNELEVASDEDVTVLLGMSSSRYVFFTELWKKFFSLQGTFFTRFLEENGEDPVATKILDDIRIAGNACNIDVVHDLFAEDVSVGGLR